MNTVRGVLLAAALAGLAAAGEPEARSFPAPQAIEIPMRDGQKLAADLYLPAAEPEGRFPTVLIQTPYNRAAYARPGNEHAGKALLDREHYVYVILDWRGFYGSKAAGNAAPGQLGRDGFDAVEWIAKQEWSDGQVGTWGASALGRVQYATAAARPPHLVCCVPVVAGYGQSYDGYYRGGVFQKAYADNMRLVGWTVGSQLAEEHPLHDGFWKFAERAPDYGKLDVPMLLLTGWFDHHTDLTIATFRKLRSAGGPKARKDSRLLVGPWEHCDVDGGSVGELKFPGAEGAAAKAATQFFDYWLRGRKDNGLEKVPVVRWYQTGANRWLESADWPPAGLAERTLYAGADGALGEEKPAGESAADELRYDPADPSPTVGGANFSLRTLGLRNSVAAGPFDQRARVESRKDCLLYTSAPLERDLALVGNAKARLFVSTDRADTDFAVRLCDVWPDGRSMLVTDGIRRLSLRDSLDRKSAVKPEEAYELTAELPAAAHCFLKGHRIRIVITGSNYPRFDRNPNNGRSEFQAGAALVASDKLWRGGGRASALVLPAMAEKQPE